jgi:hypothetical protein
MLNGSPGRPTRFFQLNPSKMNMIICRAQVVGLSEDSCIGRFRDMNSLIWSGNIHVTSTMHVEIRRKSQRPMKMVLGQTVSSIRGRGMEMAIIGSTQMHVCRMQRDSIVQGWRRRSLRVVVLIAKGGSFTTLSTCI